MLLDKHNFGNTNWDACLSGFALSVCLAIPSWAFLSAMCALLRRPTKAQLRGWVALELERSICAARE